MTSKSIKLKDYWVSETYSDPTDNKIFKTKGFTIPYHDGLWEAKETTFIFNVDKYIKLRNDDDLKCFETESDAKIHQVIRKKYWLDYLKKQVTEYQKKVDEYKN
jgi:glycyl-tRNA synthetase (class II)